MLKIEKASIDHLEQIVPLFEAYRVFYRKAPNPNAARDFLQARLDQNESVIYLAFEDNQAIGFTQLYPLFSSTRMKRLWLLNDLFVDAQHRGKGVSKLLMEQAKILARTTGAAGLSLETEQSNIIGNQLYPACGFELDKEHNYYFWTNDEA